VEIVRNLLDAFNRGDVEAVVAAFAEDGVVEEPPEVPDRPALGFRGIREWMTNPHDVAGVHFEPRSFRTSGDGARPEVDRVRGLPGAFPGPRSRRAAGVGPGLAVPARSPT
jgi:ketosteroid isomerase-like protein